MKIMLEKTDDEHGLTMPEILEELEKYGVTAERKSIYADFQDMTDKFGLDIIKENVGRETKYHVGSREFELAEVKLLIDAIQSSKFITKNKSRELISKVKTLVSEHQAKQLQRQVIINDRVKTMNESVYYNVDDIHSAINQNKQIKFKYYKWDISKKLVPRHNDEWFVVSPWALTWAEENYYLLAYDEWSGQIKNYRVDKMMKISLTNEARQGKELFDKIDMAKYSAATFGMYNGESKKVKLRIENSKCGIFLDRFGKDISFIPVDKDHSELYVDVNVSPQFYGWIFGLGKDVKVIGPQEVVDEMKEQAKRFLENMESSEQ